MGKLSELEPSVSTRVSFAPLPAFLIVRTRAPHSEALLVLFLILQGLPQRPGLLPEGSACFTSSKAYLQLGAHWGISPSLSVRWMWLGGCPEMKERMEFLSLPVLLQTSVQGQHDVNTLTKSYHNLRVFMSSR